MKASLCKLSPCTVARVCDYHAKLFLIAISSTLKSLLRPHFLNTPDKSPGDRLTEICSKITDVGGARGMGVRGILLARWVLESLLMQGLGDRAVLPALIVVPPTDIDKVMINLKTEEFVLDMSTLQALQQLLQWVGDIVLYLLASLPNQVCAPIPRIIPLGSSPMPSPRMEPTTSAHFPAGLSSAPGPQLPS